MDGQDSHWMSEKEALDSFTPLQLDVFHALWELYHPEKQPRPEEGPSKEQRDKEAREKALQLFPVNTEVRKPFVDGTGKRRVFEGRVYDFQDGYWRVEYTDGDREDMSRRDLAKWTNIGRRINRVERSAGGQGTEGWQNCVSSTRCR